MKDDFGKHAFEPVWHPCDRLRRHTLSPLERDWLLDDSSLTRRLQHTCEGGFHVELISQRFERPMLSEARALGRPIHETALVRQVRLCCSGQPMVFARTIVPLPSLKGSLRRLAMLNTRPLGAVLFADPTMQRNPLEIALITPRHRLYLMANQSSDGKLPLWGRRSVFTLQGRPLLVSELFLPTLLHKPGGNT